MARMATDDPIPQRLSDAERDEAVAMLRTHYEAGRLDEAEFAERMEAALSARTADQLPPLFTDLPDPRPAPLTPPPPPPARRHSDAVAPAPRTGAGGVQKGQFDPLGLVQALVWPLAIGMMFLGRGGWYWILAAIVVTTVIAHLKGDGKR